MNSAIDPLDSIVQILKLGRFDYVDEKICQMQIEQHFLSLGVCFEREFSLDNGIVDFYFPRSKSALEVKAAKKWRKMEVYRQIEKYCDSEEVTGLVLATGRIQGLPSLISGKPVQIYQLGVGLL